MFFQQLIENFKTIITKKYFCFNGRASRQEFWMWVLATFVIAFVLGLIPKAGGILPDFGILQCCSPISESPHAVCMTPAKAPG